MPYRSQSANRLTEQVHTTVRSVVEAAGVRHLLIACSGGVDSTCLAHAVVTIARRTGWVVSLAHIRHGVRPDDAGDLGAVRGLAERLGVALVHGGLDRPVVVTGNRTSEAALRVGRYAKLAEFARARGAAAILTGHTMDDQAETLLLHLIRGSGLDGLTGMQPSSGLPVMNVPMYSDGDAPDGLLLVRPLLGIRRADTEAYCAAHVLPVCHDVTNDDPTWRRNWLRHTVLPELRTRNPDITATLARAALSLAGDARFLREETHRALARCDHRQEAAVSTIDHRAFLNEPPALRLRMIRVLLERYNSAVPHADLAIRAEHALSSTRSSRIISFGRMACSVIECTLVVGTPDDVRAWMFRLAAARYPLFRGSRPVEVDARITFHGHPDTNVAYTSVIQAIRPTSPTTPAAALTHYLALPAGATLTLRNRQPHDRFQPLGSVHAALLQDYLSERGIPAMVRDWLPLLVVDDTIAWVIGHDFGSAFAASREQATHVARLERSGA